MDIKHELYTIDIQIRVFRDGQNSIYIQHGFGNHDQEKTHFFFTRGNAEKLHARTIPELMTNLNNFYDKLSNIKYTSKPMTFLNIHLVCPGDEIKNFHHEMAYPAIIQTLKGDIRLIKTTIDKSMEQRIMNYGGLVRKNAPETEPSGCACTIL